MKTSLFKRFVTLVMVATFSLGVFAVFVACRGTGNNENLPLILSIQQPEGVFSPFFSGTAMDGTIANQTQIGMLSVNQDGDIAFGNNYPTVTQDLSIHIEYGHPTSLRNPLGRRTVYQFVIKPDIYFSDGMPLTIRDVLFNFYMLLDNAYTGLATMNSVEIIGLRDYRTQVRGADEQQETRDRRDARTTAVVRRNLVVQYLRQPSGGYNPTTFFGPNVRADLDTAISEFDYELNMFWNNAIGSVEDMRRQYFPVQYDWEAFMFNMGLLNLQTAWNGGPPIKDVNGFFVFNPQDYNSLLRAFDDDHGGVIDRDSSIAIARSFFVPYVGIPTRMANVLLDRFTGSVVTDNLMIVELAEIHRRRAEQAADGPVRNISGIRALTGTDFRPSVESNATVNPFNSSYEMLQITIDNVDPRAIWSFGTSIAPMHWYSTREQNDLAVEDFNRYFHTTNHSQWTNFGVDRGQMSFMDEVRRMNGVPVGAGPYRVSTPQGTGGYNLAYNTTHFERLRTGFFTNNIVHFERNDHFIMGAPKIRRLRYQVVNQANVMNMLATQAVHFADPSATQANINEVSRHNHLSHQTNWTNGYGYIGISAQHIPQIGIRRAIMTAIDVRYVSDYFPGELSAPLHRGMSFESWIHRDYDDAGRQIGYWANGRRSFFGTDAYGVNIDAIENREARQTARIAEVNRHLMGVPGDSRYPGVDGLVPGPNGWLLNGDPLRFTFNVAGNSTDHPAWMMFDMAADLLNENGWDITVRPNNAVLRLLTAGQGLEVWAAAWSSGIDPDMFQLWHRDSTAPSVRNWGYRQILEENPGGFIVEGEIINRLSDYIDRSRSVLDRRSRTDHIRNALDTAMELAVELPTYQRVDMFVVNTRLIDESSLQYPISSHWGPLSRIWEVSFR